MGIRSRQRGGMIGHTELPGVGQENRNHFSWLQPRCNQAASQILHQLPILREGDALTARGVHQHRFCSVLLAGGKNRIVQKNVGGIGVEFGAQHGGMIVAERGGGQITREPSFYGRSIRSP